MSAEQIAGLDQLLNLGNAVNAARERAAEKTKEIDYATKRAAKANAELKALEEQFEIAKQAFTEGKPIPAPAPVAAPATKESKKKSA